MSDKTLFNELEDLAPALGERLSRVSSLDDLEEARVEFLGRKGCLAGIMSRLPGLPAEMRPEAGRRANQVKAALASAMETKLRALEPDQERLLAAFDPSLPGRVPERGTMHPAGLVMEEICVIFEGLGYEVVSGPEVETDYYNFEALNLPAEHPARDMQDTLYINDSIVLRTHTSPLQVRTMQSRVPPLAVIAPGRVYRRDSDLTHSPMFHQVEGLLVDTKVSMADLRGTLTYFLQRIFNPDVKVRFRPSFFPFTEPSAEADISCVICGGEGRVADGPCRVCKQTGWVEILGCGMVDPAVFSTVDYDPEKYSGFAFGLGVERVAMLKYGIGDLRLFFENDLRFLRQF